MRFILLFFLLHVTLLADKDGNGKCWQREKIQELHRITKTTQHTEYGNVIADKKGDHTDYYYFSTRLPSHFDLIFSSNHPVSLHVGTSCNDSSFLDGRNDTQYALLEQNSEKTVYIRVVAESEKPTSYEIHVTVTSNSDDTHQTDYNTTYGSHFDCEIINGNVTCKR
ncbi:MAG: hypothetical protein U9R50_09445 [Campylobacterota bacterium]|nr:hypothetical protein [Campylobacterota bacterium]